MEIVDFSVTVMESEIVVVQEFGAAKNSIFLFLSPFSNEIWFCISIAFFVIIILLGSIIRLINFLCQNAQRSCSETILETTLQKHCIPQTSELPRSINHKPH